MAGVLRERKAPEGVLLALACLAQFMVVLDVSIVNVALPSIRNDLGFSASGLQWVVNAYVLTFAGFLLLGGRAADLFGRRRVYLFGLVLFCAASLAGGLATTPTVLTVARAAQGIGGAVLSPATLTIIMTTYGEGRDRVKALGAWSAVAGAGGAAGAIAGGVLTNYLSWRWILFVNVPIGALAAAGALAFLSETTRRGSERNLDVLGAVLATAGLTALVYGIVETDSHSWTSPRTLIVLAVAVVLLAAFLVVEKRFAPSPLMPLRLFRSRPVSGANLSILLVGAAFFSMWYFLSLYLQSVRGYGPLRTGMAFLPMALAIILGAQISSRLVAVLGVRSVLVGGMVLTAGGFLWLAQLSAHSAYLSGVFGAGVLLTFGFGLSLAPLATAATTGVARSEAGLASGLLNTSRQVGGSIGLAALATAATARTNAVLRHHAPGAGALRGALTAGYTRAFAAGAVIIVGAAAAGLIIPRSRRAPTPTPAPGPGATRPEPAGELS